MKNFIFTKTNKKILLTLTAIIAFGFITKAQNVNIPDPTFKAYLVGNTAINTNGDTEIQVSEANAYSGVISVNQQNIFSLTGIEYFTSLTELYCFQTNLTGMDLSQNVALERLDCGNNNIINLDLSNNTALYFLYCSGNDINSLDLSNNTALVDLSCEMNNLTSLDLSNNNLLYSLKCGQNNITSLDLSNLTLLDDFNCFSNNLNAIDLSNNTVLRSLSFSQNNITSLDLSNHSLLEEVVCSDNLLTSLNVANGNNINFTFFYAINNPNLTCIEVDNPATSLGSTDWYKDATATYSLNCGSPCTVNIPDASFKAYLVGNTAINTNGNTEIECSEATAFTGSISCINLNINDLTGIEAFTSLNSLQIANNDLTTLDVSNNTALTTLSCTNNDLTSLDVSMNTNLNSLACDDNPLTTLDVTQNTALTFLYCGFTDLSTIDLSNNTALETLNCQNAQFTSLSLDNNTNLDYLYCLNNQLSTIDVSNNTLLNNFNINNNQISSLDVSTNSSLSNLYFANNQITSADISDNLNIKVLVCDGNQLTSLNAANGNNANFFVFNASNNPNLTCIEVDDVAYSTANWTNIDPASSFSENCGVVTPVLVSSITVQGQGGISTITTNGGTLQMEADVLPMNADDATYTWSVNNSNASISATGILTALANGTIEVTATANDASGTVGTKTITISNQSVGINDLAFENVSIFPNPTNGNINLNVSEKLSSIRIMDLTGKTIQVFNAETTQLDISVFTTGIYFLEIANAERKSVVKIIKK